jgi:hypothetical protein
MRTVYVDAPGPRRPEEPLIEHEGELYTRSAVASNYARHYCVGGIYCTRHDGYLAAWKRANMAPEPVDTEAELIREAVAARKKPLQRAFRAIGAYMMSGFSDE